jgi:hypothetical protein
VARDVISFTLGWVLIFQQALFVDPSRVNEAFLWVAAALLGVPGASEVVARIRAGTGGSGSASASDASEPWSSTSSSGGDP